MVKTLRKKTVSDGSVVRLKKLADGSYVITQQTDGREGRVDEPFRADSFDEALQRFKDDVDLIQTGVDSRRKRSRGGGGLLDADSSGWF